MAALLAWGANSYGQLCLGHKEDTLEPSACDIPGELLLEDVSSITGGGGHTMLVTSECVEC
jgi:alpha-tubulin suppressor-like RCC1 family protein